MIRSLQSNGIPMKTTIQKTLMTARLFSGFWDRWSVHGVEDHVVSEIRPQLGNLEVWTDHFNKSGQLNENLAHSFYEKHLVNEAEYYYRLSALYYNLNQWIYPKQNDDKTYWFQKCLISIRKADAISSIDTRYVSIEISNHTCFGRVRLPANPVGCIIIVNPIDSSKEELFKYEMDFIRQNFITISFDGPGQGETYTFQGLKATQKRWMDFTDTVIEYAWSLFPDIPLYLFGTSSGASWAIYGSCNPKVTKAVAVSPAIRSEGIDLPAYFIERMNSVIEDKETILPNLHQFNIHKPIFMFHGALDVMTSSETIYNLYDRLPSDKKFLEYEGEGHCCNYKLEKIRKLSMMWYLE